MTTSIANIYSSVTAFLNRHSHTTFTVTSADANNIYLYVSNTGLAPSKLVSYELHLRDVGVEDRKLELIPDDKTKGHSIIRPGDTNIGLTCTGLRALRHDPDKLGRYTKEEIAQLLENRDVRLVIAIRESNGWKHEIDDSFLAEHLHDFLMHWIPEHDTQ